MIGSGFAFLGLLYAKISMLDLRRFNQIIRIEKASIDISSRLFFAFDLCFVVTCSID